MLYVLITTTFVTKWMVERRAFIEYSNNYYSAYAALSDGGLWWRVNYLISGITGGISTILVDITIVCHLIRSQLSGEEVDIW